MTRLTRRMNIATIGGQRLLIMGLGDGGVYAMKPQTGEKVWGMVVAKRGTEYRRGGERKHGHHFATATKIWIPPSGE